MCQRFGVHSQSSLIPILTDSLSEHFSLHWCSYCLSPLQLLPPFPKALVCCPAMGQIAPCHSAWCATDQLSCFSLADSLVCRVSSPHPSPQTPVRQEGGPRAQMAFLALAAGIRILVMFEALWLSLESDIDVWQCPQ